jgi:hypothetical protein
VFELDEKILQGQVPLIHVIALVFRYRLTGHINGWEKLASKIGLIHDFFIYIN